MHVLKCMDLISIAFLLYLPTYITKIYYHSDGIYVGKMLKNEESNKKLDLSQTFIQVQ